MAITNTIPITSTPENCIPFQFYSRICCINPLLIYIIWYYLVLYNLWSCIVYGTEQKIIQFHWYLPLFILCDCFLYCLIRSSFLLMDMYSQEDESLSSFIMRFDNYLCNGRNSALLIVWGRHHDYLYDIEMQEIISWLIWNLNIIIDRFRWRL